MPIGFIYFRMCALPGAAVLTEWCPGQVKNRSPWQQSNTSQGGAPSCKNDNTLNKWTTYGNAAAKIKCPGPRDWRRLRSSHRLTNLLPVPTALGLTDSVIWGEVILQGRTLPWGDMTMSLWTEFTTTLCSFQSPYASENIDWKEGQSTHRPGCLPLIVTEKYGCSDRNTGVVRVELGDRLILPYLIVKFSRKLCSLKPRAHIPQN